MNFTETLLPGVGVRYDATTRAGVALSIVLDREGGAEVATYLREDPDAVDRCFRFSPHEAAAIAEILGGTRVGTRVADLSKEVPGLCSGRFTIAPGSRYDGRRLGDTKARTRTGCSLVAIVRGDTVLAAPGPHEALHGGDIVLAIGSELGLEDLGVILGMTPEEDAFPVPAPQGR